ncbi:CHAP domain-containing protein [Gordonia sp. CPCC 205515]|uniref:CHAP domain-containing protein n=1 Tax=Gordonia sp. CPCC 205515 TaxID=3140791 RepID=UPI003AF38DC3
MRTRRLGVAGVVVAVVVVAALALWWPHGESGSVIERATGTGAAARPEFPGIDPALVPVRARILAVARDEYLRNPPGTAFSEGEEQPWCADFVSSTMRAAGVPLSNPNSGSWRIPGVATLTDYYQSTGRLRSAERSPQPGDVVLYDVPSPLGQHTNLVVARRGDEVITVGGNERQGVTLRTYRVGGEAGIQGYGVPAA